MYDIFYTQCMMKKICPKSEFVCGFSSSSAAVEAGHCCVARSRGRVSVVEGAGSRACWTGWLDGKFCGIA